MSTQTADPFDRPATCCGMNHRYFSPLVVGVCVTGTALSVLIAFVPLVSIGYLLRLDVLLAGLLPYFFYACAAWLRRDGFSLLVGAVLLALDVWLRLPVAFEDPNGHTQVVFTWPLLAAAGVILAYWLMPAIPQHAAAKPNADEV